MPFPIGWDLTCNLTRGANHLGKVPDWRIYERIAACFEIEAAGMDTSVTPNAQLVGSISGVSRQIDILVDARWTEGQETRIIYDAKRRKRKLTVQDVDTFVGLMEDVRARRGVLICTNGWTAAAKKRADETIDLRLLTEEDAEEANHAAMDPCPHCRNSHRKTEVDLILAAKLCNEWGPPLSHHRRGLRVRHELATASDRRPP